MTPQHSLVDSVAQVPDYLLRETGSRNIVRRLKARAGATAMAVTAPLHPRGEHGFGVVNYHRVHPTKGLPLSVTPRAFDRQIRGLLKRGYKPFTVEQYIDAVQAGERVPRKAFSITFDDAFDNVRRYALPILDHLGVPATAYLATAFIGAREFPFDPLVYQGGWSGAEDVTKPLSLEGCRELQSAGWEIGVHTHTHRYFLGHAEEFRVDLQQSIDFVREQFDVSDPTFSFPYGGLDESLRSVCRELSVRCALTTDAGLILPNDDPYNWARLGAEEFDSGSSLVAKLNGWYTAARQCWRRVAYGEATPCAKSFALGAQQTHGGAL